MVGIGVAVGITFVLLIYFSLTLAASRADRAMERLQELELLGKEENSDGSYFKGRQEA